MEAENPYSERLLGFTRDHRRHAKIASRLDSLRVFGLAGNFIRVFTSKVGVFFHVFLRIERQLFHGRAKALEKTRMF